MNPTRISRPRALGLIVAAALFTGVPAITLQQGLYAGQLESGKEIRRTFDVRPGGTLTLEAQGGSVEVRTSSEPKVTVVITFETYRGGRWGDLEDIEELYEVEFDQSGKDVLIRGRWRGRWSRRNRLRIHYLITVPRKYSGDISTSGGSVEVADLDGNLRVSTSGGGVKMGHISGTVKGRTSGGSIRLAGSGGDVDLRTSGGAIKMGSAKGTVTAKTSGGSIDIGGVEGAIQARTSGGSITARILGQPTSSSVLETSGGGITLYLADDLKLDIDARASGGGVRSDLPVTVTHYNSRRTLRGTINGGGPELYLRTSGGSIRLLKD